MTLELVLALAYFLLLIVFLILGWRVYRWTGSGWALRFAWVFGLGFAGNLLAVAFGLAAVTRIDDPTLRHWIAEATGTTQRIDYAAMWLAAIVVAVGWLIERARLRFGRT
jgi:phosphoglycerol transferase MdoB-like AlkP superfamily enzyme